MNSHMAEVHGLKKFNQLLERSFQPQPDFQPSSSKNVERKAPKRKADPLGLAIKIAKIEKDIRQIDKMNEELEVKQDPLDSINEDENNNDNIEKTKEKEVNKDIE